MVPSITQDAVNTALGTFLTAILPAGVTVIVGQVNRVASPEGDYVVMWPLRRPRLGTNLETPNDTKFTASIAATTMTVTALLAGSIGVGNQVFGVNVADGTVVVSQTSGPTGGAGVYVVAPSQNVASETMSTGVIDIEQDTDVVMQCDCHGASGGDNAQVISTMMRSAYAVDQMEASGVTPLYAEDPRQTPFTTAAAQWEDRWSIDVHLEINPVVSVPQEFADAVTVTPVVVDVAFPPQ
jgi:hypothetical protein